MKDECGVLKSESIAVCAAQHIASHVSFFSICCCRHGWLNSLTFFPISKSALLCRTKFVLSKVVDMSLAMFRFYHKLHQSGRTQASSCAELINFGTLFLKMQ